MRGVHKSHFDNAVWRRLGTHRRREIRQFLEPIPRPNPSGPLRSDIPLRIAPRKEPAPHGAALVSAKTSQGGSNPPGGLRRLSIHASQDVLAAGCDEPDSAIASGLEINRKTVMLWGRFAEQGLESLREPAPWQGRELIYRPERIKVIVDATRDQAEGNWKGLVGDRLMCNLA